MHLHSSHSRGQEMVGSQREKRTRRLPSADALLVRENSQGQLVSDRYGIMYAERKKSGGGRDLMDWRDNFATSDSSGEERSKAARSPAERESLAPLMGSKAHDDVIRARRHILNKKNNGDEKEKYENSKGEEPYETLPLSTFTNVDSATIAMLREILNYSGKKDSGKDYINMNDALEENDLERKKESAERLALDAFMTPSVVDRCALNLSREESEPYVNSIISGTQVTPSFKEDKDIYPSKVHSGKNEKNKMFENLRHSLESFLAKSTRQKKKKSDSQITTIFDNETASARTANSAKEGTQSIASRRDRRSRRKNHPVRKQSLPATFHAELDMIIPAPVTFRSELDEIIGGIYPMQPSKTEWNGSIEITASSAGSVESAHKAFSRASLESAYHSFVQCRLEKAKEDARKKIFIGVCSSQRAARKLRASSLPFVVYYKSDIASLPHDDNVPFNVHLFLAYKDRTMKHTAHFPIEEIEGVGTRAFAVMHGHGTIRMLPSIAHLIDFHLTYGIRLSTPPTPAQPATSATSCDCPYETV